MTVASGARVSLIFGKGDKTVGGKKTKVDLIAKVSQSTITALGIKFKKAGSAKPKIIIGKGKAKARRLPTVTGTKSGKRKLLCSIDGAKFYSVIVPTGMPYGVAAEAIAKESKAIAFKTPSGTTFLQGEIKAKASAKPKAKAKPRAKRR